MLQAFVLMAGGIRQLFLTNLYLQKKFEQLNIERKKPLILIMNAVYLMAASIAQIIVYVYTPNPKIHDLLLIPTILIVVMNLVAVAFLIKITPKTYIAFTVVYIVQAVINLVFIYFVLQYPIGLTEVLQAVFLVLLAQNIWWEKQVKFGPDLNETTPLPGTRRPATSKATAEKPQTKEKSSTDKE